MGWASGNELYDEVIDIVYDHVGNYSLVRTIADKIAGAFEDSDWDTQDDSAWYVHLFIEGDSDTRRNPAET